ncbi:unnamed protein product [Brassicogethes aeneus]|uniref:Tudor domain-containing protein n=1 Tax=Brassicogethes aeneus TaxID=1431903 RepID=A0A9P0AYR1_BRAAE|nr:unnamed protein product [Brassicogethes aeneus]
MAKQSNNESSCVILHGFDPVLTRQEIIEELSTYGDIYKVYIPEEKDYAKIYFSSIRQALSAVKYQSKRKPNWKLQLFNTYQEMQAMDYCEEVDDLVLNSDYVDIHGRNLDVLEGLQGEIFISLKEIKQTGFAIFRRENFEPTLRNTNQILREFEMHLLSEAKKFLLQNHVVTIGQEQILETIRKCEERLLGAAFTTEKQQPRSEFRDNSAKLTTTIDNRNSPRSKPTFAKSHSDNSSNNSFESVAPRQLPKNFAPNNQTTTMSPQQKSTQLWQNKNPRSNGSDFNANSGGGPMRQPKTTPVFSTENKAKFDEKSSLNNERMNKSSSSSGTSDNSRKRFFSGDYIKQIDLPLFVPLKLKITCIYKENTAWATLEDNIEIQEDILLKTNEEANNMPIIKDPKLGTLGMAEYDGTWCRVIVKDSNPLKVYYVDFGGIGSADCIKEVPKSIKDIAAQAIHLVQCKEDSLIKWAIDDVINVQAKQKYDSGSFLVTSKDLRPKTSETRKRNDYVLDFEKSESRPEKAAPVLEVKEKAEIQCYFDIPEPLTIKDGDKVMIIDCDDKGFILRTRELTERFLEVTQMINNVNKPDLNLETVQKGQMVLCGKDECAGLFRAEVTDVKLPIVSVSYIDVTGNVSISLKALRNVTSQLAGFPATLAKSPTFPDLGKYLKNPDSIAFIEDLIMDKVKLTVTLDGGCDFVLKNGIKMSKVLADLVNPPPKAEEPKLVEKPKVTEVPVPEKKEEDVKKPAETGKSSGPVNYEDMAFTKIEIGKEDEFLCYSFEAMDQLTILSMENQEVEWLTYLNALTIKDEEPYSPNLWEMCMALFKDGEWYRGVVISSENNEFSVLFVDFGNTEIITKKDLRKYPDDLKNIPILGIMCELVGVPHKEEIFKKLKSTMTDGEQIKVHVKSYDEETFKYQVELPDEYKKLKSDGLV